MARIVIDPVTRVGGHLRVEAELEAGVVRDAWLSATSYRGVEGVLVGRDPRGVALAASRICGACTGVHAQAAVGAVEQALGVTIPPNARLVRNLLAGIGTVRDHVLQLSLRSVLDWVDVPAALRADPASTSRLARTMGDWPNWTGAYFRDVRDRVEAAVRAGQGNPFAGGPTGHPDVSLPPEAGLLVLAHALEALEWQRAVARTQALLGGKDVHPQSWLVGGMSLAPPWGGPAGAPRGEHPRQVTRNNPIALGDRGLGDLGAIVEQARRFVEQVFVPDVILLARHYPAWTRTHGGPGSFLSFGAFPEANGARPAALFPAGRVSVRNLVHVAPADPRRVTETAARAWYADEAGGPDPSARAPAAGRTVPRYDGPPLPYRTLAGSRAYSWLKAARYDGLPTEVGPLARVLVGYAAADPAIRSVVERVLAGAGVGADALVSTLGRTLARAVEALVLVERLEGWRAELVGNLASGDLAIADVTRWDPSSWPAEVEGWSAGEGPRGSVGHWLRIRGGRLDHYQVVDATGWNASPRDASDRRGPLEEALLGTTVADPSRPVEILRVVHAFDPCTACGVH